MGNRTYAPLAVAVFGVSTPHSYWVFHLVHRIVEAIAGPTLRLHIGSLQQLREGFEQRHGRSVVITSDLPETELSDFICVSGLPVIAIADDIIDSLAWAKASRLFGIYDATRFCTQMLSALAPAFLQPNALIFNPQQADSAERMTTRVIDYLFPERGESVARQAFEHLSGAGYIARDDFVDRTAFLAEIEAGDEPARRMYTAALLALSGYAELFGGAWPAQIDWPMELFRRPNELPPAATIDLTGPARTLFFGPYLHLPVGDWTAQVQFEIDEAYSGSEAVADVRVHETVAKKAFALPAKGIYTYDLDFSVDTAAHDIEIRLYMTKGAIEGVFMPRSVRLRRREPSLGSGVAAT
jgi:hypothetical protein